MHLPPPAPAPRGGLTALTLPARPVHPAPPSQAPTPDFSPLHESRTPPPGPLSARLATSGHAPFPSPALRSLFSQLAATPHEDGKKDVHAAPGSTPGHGGDGATRASSLATPGTPGIEDRASTTHPSVAAEATLSSGDPSSPSRTVAGGKILFEGRFARQDAGGKVAPSGRTVTCDPAGSLSGPAHVAGRPLGARPMWEEYVRLAGESSRMIATPEKEASTTSVSSRTGDALGCTTPVERGAADNTRSAASGETEANSVTVDLSALGRNEGALDVCSPHAGDGEGTCENDTPASQTREACRATRRDAAKPLVSCALQTLSESSPCLIPSILKSDRLHPLPDVHRGELPSILKADSVDWTVAEAVREVWTHIPCIPDSRKDLSMGS
jgi:hypothetical protein